MTRQAVILVLTLFLCAAHQVSAQEGKELVLKSVKALLEKPLDKETGALRKRALKWVIETDEVTVVVCSLIDPFVDRKYKFGGEVGGAYTLGMAAFKFGNPGNGDENAAQTAGVETALKVYEKILADQPKSRSSDIDALIVKRESGGLKAYVAAAECGEKR